MTMKVTVRDEVTGATPGAEITLELPPEPISVAELIRSRVYQEVKDFNLKQPEVYCGLVQPDDAEVALNGYRVRKTKQVDWRRQYEAALKAYEDCQLLVFVDDKQTASLGEVMELTSRTKITFLKLVPLAGG